jgi:hypothetical protein
VDAWTPNLVCLSICKLLTEFAGPVFLVHLVTFGPIASSVRSGVSGSGTRIILQPHGPELGAPPDDRVVSLTNNGASINIANAPSGATQAPLGAHAFLLVTVPLAGSWVRPLACDAYKSTLNRVRTFVQQGGGCRATY